MNAKTLSGLTAIAVAAVSMSLGACDQRSPGSASTSGSAPATSAQPSSPMTGTPAGQMATPSSPAGDKAAAGAVDDAALTAQVKSALQSEAGAALAGDRRRQQERDDHPDGLGRFGRVEGARE